MIKFDLKHFKYLDIRKDSGVKVIETQLDQLTV
jgi:hypothetical protein